MLEMKEAPIASLEGTQATQLSQLVDLEARWENLRQPPSRVREVEASTQDLQGRQKAYETFRGKLVAYNKQHTPAHVPELLLNTASRLGAWCRRMRDLYIRVEHDPRVPCPVHLLEKAFRWADRVAVRMNKTPVSRSAPPETIRAAIEGLEAVLRWCDALADGAGQLAIPVVPASTLGVRTPHADS